MNWYFFNETPFVAVALSRGQPSLCGDISDAECVSLLFKMAAPHTRVKDYKQDVPRAKSCHTLSQPVEE